MTFPTDLASIEQRLTSIDFEKYAGTRNFVDGAVTYLSPYISRGVISTKQIYALVKEMDLPWHSKEKFIMELAWRDYFQQVWVAKKEEILEDLKNEQKPVENYQIPKAIVHASTGINAVDEAIKNLYTSGYMHNHMRMYVASICCNVANSHWLTPAKWLYGNLLDGDVASNHLSWQWIAGTFSSKKYYANQENINKYFKTDQNNTFLSVDYSEFENLQVPQKLLETISFDLVTKIPTIENPILEKDAKTFVYNYYNIDPYWHKGENAQRVFLLEPSFFKKYPVSDHCIKFVLALCENVDGIKIYVGEFSELKAAVEGELVYKEHPTNEGYVGIEEPRDWMTDVKGYFPSFSAFYKKAKK